MPPIHRSTDPPIHRSTDFSKRKYLEMIDLPSVGSRRRERPFFLIFPAADWSLYCALYHRRRQRPRTWPRILQLEFDIFSGFSFLFFSFLFFFFCTIDTVNSPLFRFPDENNQSGSGNSSNIYKLVNLYIKDVTGFLSAAG